MKDVIEISQTRDMENQSHSGSGDNIAGNKIINVNSSGEEKKRQRILDSRNSHLEQIAKLPQETVFGEDFTFNDIYVPLKAKHLNGYDDFILQDWVQETILGNKQKDKVIVIQGGPGRGKSVFCRMFADKVRQELASNFIPIVIRLREIEHFEDNLKETLKKIEVIEAFFVRHDENWLYNTDIPYLFILDGFDELRLEGRSKVSLEDFLRQIADFQRNMNRVEIGHRVILTGRTIAFQGLNIPDNLTQVEIQTMDENLRDKWLWKWQKLVGGKKILAFLEFLTAEECPEKVRKELTVEPLLLYMLATMHRDEAIKLKDFQGNSKTNGKITIYEKALEWVLTKQRDKHTQYLATGISQDEFEERMESILMESALAVVQSGGESAQLQMIESRLENKPEAEILEKLKKIEGKKALNIVLGVFYIRVTNSKEGGMEFYHKSFSEFLFAKRIYSSMTKWVEKDDDEYLVKNADLAEQIYDLLGYGGLSEEIVEYWRGLLDTNANKNFSDQKVVIVFQRLNKFYRDWCKGKFIDAEKKILPHEKMCQLKPYVDEDKNLGQRQVDVLTGLNVMILLLELHRYGIDSGDKKLKQQLNFHPCGEVDKEGRPKDKDLLLKIIGYSHCLGITGFVDTVGKFLSHANLEYANLYYANLEYAHLNHANLYYANLEYANLEYATLDNAHLNNARLDNAHLDNANLNYAHLNHAHLNHAHLNYAHLNHANLNHANLYYATLDNAHLNNAQLNNAFLYNAHLDNALLNNAQLNNAQLTDALLNNAQLNNANLNNANLTDATLYNANLNNANLNNANLNNATLYNANLTDAKNLTNAQIKSAIN